MNRIQPRRALFRERPIWVVARMQKDDLKVDRIVLNNNNTPVEHTQASLMYAAPHKPTKGKIFCSCILRLKFYLYANISLGCNQRVFLRRDDPLKMTKEEV